MEERNDIRLLSSLRDLRLRSKCEMVITEQRKRKQKRLCPIKLRPEDQQIYENFEIYSKKKNLLDISFISKSLAVHFTFSALIADKALHDQLINQFRFCKVQKNEYLLKQNDSASSFFILADGELQVEVNGCIEGVIKNGDGFGELALLYSTPRSASILAKKESYLWFIDRTTFRNIVSSMIEKSFTETKKFVNENQFFAYLTDKQKNKMISIAITQRYEQGTKICREGENACAMYIIKKGKVSRSIDGMVVGSFRSGDSFEEYATLSKNIMRKETIIADEPTQIIAFGVDQIEKVLGKSLPIIILRNRAKNALKENKHFSQLSKEFLEKIIDCFKIQKIQKGEKLFNKGDLLRKKVFFLIQGQISSQSKTQKTGNLLYGSDCLKENSKDETFSFSCQMSTEGRIAITSLQEIEKTLGFTIDEAIKKSNSIKNIKEGRKSLLEGLKSLSKDFDLKKFLVLKKLGQGQFGQVFLVSHQVTKKCYALKCISKADTVKYKLEKHLINEKTVLESNNSPFTVDFIRSFKDNYYIYFLTEFIEGLELFDALRAIGLVPINLAQFYIANIILAVESLHNKGIVYRDLKPENVMVQADGYLKIIDMGTCKDLKNSSSQKTFTIIGTPNYMAPQILSGRGYGFEVDLWSLGIMLFEFLSGYLPFGENFEDPYEIYEEIIKTQLKFPKYMKNVDANNLISKLLNRNPESRLGISFSSLKNHSFFKDVEWFGIFERTFEPCFKPTKEHLLNATGINKNPKTIENFLNFNPQASLTRANLPENWDSCF